MKPIFIHLMSFPSLLKRHTISHSGFWFVGGCSGDGGVLLAKLMNCTLCASGKDILKAPENG